MADPTLFGEVEYEELDEIWEWSRVKEFQLRGHLDRIEDDMITQAALDYHPATR